MTKKSKEVATQAVEIKPNKKIEVDLASVEKEMQAKVFNADVKAWAETYRLMTKVRDEGLWHANAEATSWANWVKLMADKSGGTSESTLWRRYRTARFYFEYQKKLDRFESNVKLPALGTGNMTISKLDLMAQIDNMKNADRVIDGVNLDDKYVDGLMLKLAENNAVKKSDLEKLVSKATKKPAELGEKKAEEDLSEAEKLRAWRLQKVKDIINTLRKDHSWLAPKSADRRKNGFYKVVPDLVIDDPKTGVATALDIVVFENLSSKKSEVDSLKVHVIKLLLKNKDVRSKRVVKNILKTSDYGDCFWLLSLDDLKKQAVELRTNYGAGWGLLSVEEVKKRKKVEGEKIEKVDDSKLVNGTAKDKLITAALMQTQASVGGRLHEK